MREHFFRHHVLRLSVTVYFVCIAAPSVFFGKGLKGSGNIVTRTIEAPAFDRIDAARAVKVVITDKTSGKITIAADDNVMDYVVVEANGASSRPRSTSR